jgi:hypothetical protein
MPPATAIASVGPAKRREFVSHEMLASCASMTATAKNADLVYKIAFLQIGFNYDRYKYSLRSG